MMFHRLPIDGAYLIGLEPRLDDRGSFTRIVCLRELRSIGHTKGFVQVNVSLTRTTGTVRGLHFQHPPKTETKLVTCIEGRVFDVILDLRHASSTFLSWHGEELTEDNRKVMYVPDGVAHGFQTLEQDTRLLYFHTNYYAPDYEDGVLYNDPKLRIEWPLPITAVSKRDRTHKRLPDDYWGIDL
jgi:dTDP-4-dehydrorhamnose 3,5-epimerase